VESPEEPGFYQLWGELPYCPEDPNNPYVSATKVTYKVGERIFGLGLYGKIGFRTMPK
jgi:hypothetical protein